MLDTKPLKDALRDFQAELSDSQALYTICPEKWKDTLEGSECELALAKLEDAIDKLEDVIDLVDEINPSLKEIESHA